MITEDIGILETKILDIIIQDLKIQETKTLALIIAVVGILVIVIQVILI